MRVTRIDAATHPLAGEWWRLYEAAFPASERRSADWHAVALADPAFHVQHLADAAGFVGILSYWKWAGLTYVEHLAIVPERRGQGLGRRALSLLSRPLILEIEPVVDAATARRLAFYESCGLVRLPQPHVQLAYQTGQPDVPLWLLSQPALDAAEVARFEELFMAGPMRYRARA
ncbi:MAG: GNAT family N-acetyltransferase [Akkermansia sp.]|nr:GNAT family N-acetyltransferase [Akkermansia sp.]